MTRRMLAVLIVLIATPRLAEATGWGYCLAPSHAQHRVYISQPFPLRGRDLVPDPEFAQMLRQDRIAHNDVQCPLTDSEARTVVMRRQALHYNRLAGNTIIRLKWKP